MAVPVAVLGLGRVGHGLWPRPTHSVDRPPTGNKANQ